MQSRVLRIFSRLRFEKQFTPTGGVKLYDLRLETLIVRIVPEHRQLVAALKVGGNEKAEFLFRLDTATGTKIVRFVNPVKTGPTDADHFLKFFLAVIFADPKQRDVMNHNGTKQGGQLRHSRAPFFSA